ncbi:T9SS type A sorting domain-containing protein [Crocinitomix catalasitica]|uniref:T9SS type A sorting domain-containing protein n=1 Tax=Crocinitomix catalasitica TaxID=184607 RepID=UPI00146F9450|nr:T9SS type A sorting domain-containing protein [Crocinitomix catalasitica]
MKKHRIILLFCVLIFNTITFSQVTDGLFAEYLFNDGTADATVGDVDGVVSNAYLANDRFGCPGKAYNFVTGDQSVIGLGNNFNDEFATPDLSWSVSAWVKLSDRSANNSFILAKYGSDGPNGCDEHQRQFIIRKSPAGKISLTFYSRLTGPTHYVVASGSTSINDTLWHHIVINYDGSTDAESGLARAEIYLDNVRETLFIEGSAGTLSNIPVGTAHLSIGQAMGSDGEVCNPTRSYHWPGYLDDFKFYNRILLDWEVDLLFNVTSSCCDINTSISAGPNTIYIDEEADGAEYQWIDCSTMDPIPGETNAYYFPETVGNYACIISQGECTDTTDCIEAVGLSINTLTENNFNIFPNPSKGFITIESYHINKNVNLTILDELGREVYKATSIPRDYKLDLTNFENGIYFLQLKSNDGNVTKKLSVLK